MKSSIRKTLLIIPLLALMLASFCVARFWNNVDRGIRIESAQLMQHKDFVAFSADIDYAFNSRIVAALNNGISIPIDIELVFQQRIIGAWYSTQWKMTIPYQLRYLALSKNYQLSNQRSGSKRLYATRQAAISALGKIRNMPVNGTLCAATPNHCLLQVRVRLNQEKLPLPLRVIAYTTGDWYFSSHWFVWPSAS